MSLKISIASNMWVCETCAPEKLAEDVSLLKPTSDLASDKLVLVTGNLTGV